MRMNPSGNRPGFEKPLCSGKRMHGSKAVGVQRKRKGQVLAILLSRRGTLANTWISGAREKEELQVVV